MSLDHDFAAEERIEQLDVMYRAELAAMAKREKSRRRHWRISLAAAYFAGAVNAGLAVWHWYRGCP